MVESEEEKVFFQPSPEQIQIAGCTDPRESWALHDLPMFLGGGEEDPWNAVAYHIAWSRGDIQEKG